MENESRYWVLNDENVPVPATLDEWGAFMENPERFLKRQRSVERL